MLTWKTLKQIPFMVVFTIGKFVFIPIMDLEQLIAMRRPAAKSVFMSFCAKADFFAHGMKFSV